MEANMYRVRSRISLGLLIFVPFLPANVLISSAQTGASQKQTVNDRNPAAHEAADRVQVYEAGELLTLDTGALVLQLDLSTDGAVLLRSLKNRNSGHEWAASGNPTGMNLASAPITATGLSPGSGFHYVGHSTHPAPRGGTELRLALEHSVSNLLATLHITAYPNSPAIDFCLHLKNNGHKPIRNLSRFDPVSLPLPVRANPYRAHWVMRDQYALHSKDVTKSLIVDGGNWNGPVAAGWLALQDVEHAAVLVAGIEWERHWAFELRRENDKGALRLSAGLTRACTRDLAPGEDVESPHVFLGIASGDLDDAVNVTQDYLQAYVFQPLPPKFPWLSYDIWSTEEKDVESRILNEAKFAAEKLGVEVFYHDASWYRGSDVSNKERWGIGLGSYIDDKRKLPMGLRHLADNVHHHGMKFGLWVCPEMVDTTVMEREGVLDAWMTKRNGQFNVQQIDGWNPMKMLCLGNPEAEAHVRDNLLRIVDEFRLNWLKWDASGLPGLDVVCDRADHGHQQGNGSQAAVVAKYRILDALIKKYPDLIIEQCSYGTRLDYGMARHGARANWLSDSTAPSWHVRNNVMAASYVFPSAYSYAWIMLDDEVSKPQTPVFLDTMFRSRMMGGFGFGTLHGSLKERVSFYRPEVIEAGVRNVKNYKSYRHLLAQHVYHLTTPGKANDWQGMQYAARDHSDAVVFLFRNGSPEATHRFKLRGLDPAKRYEVVQLNNGAKVVLEGAVLMQEGLKVRLDREPQESEIVRLIRAN